VHVSDQVQLRRYKYADWHENKVGDVPEPSPSIKPKLILSSAGRDISCCASDSHCGKPRRTARGATSAGLVKRWGDECNGAGCAAESYARPDKRTLGCALSMAEGDTESDQGGLWIP
jgi:hypothetical protein